MLFDRQLSHRGFVAGVLFVLAMGTAPAAPAVPSTPIEGTSYFVAPAGVGVSTDRTRPGNVNDTVRRICDGTATQIAGGDAIVFLDGVYLTSSLNLPLPADTRQSGRHGNAVAMLDKNCGGPLYIKLLADSVRGAVLRNDVTANDTSGGFDIRASSYIWIEGFRILGINQPSVPWEGGIKFSNGSHHVVARNNYIEGTGGGGIGAGGATHIRIENNEIVNTSNMHPYCASAISLYRLENAVGAADDDDGYSNYVVGNRVFGTRSRAGCDADTNPANGVRSSDGNCVIFDLNNETGYANRTLVANNLCVDNGGGGVHVFNSSHVDVINNTLYANGAAHRIGDLSVTCSAAGSTVRDVRFINNLVWATSAAPAVASNFNSGCAMDGIVHAHNVFVGNAPLVNDFLGVPYLQTTTDVPQFRGGLVGNLVGLTAAEMALKNVSGDPQSADFRVGAATSPVVDAGLASDCAGATPCARPVLPSTIALDNQGAPRLSGSVIDVGALEWQASSASPPTSSPPPAATAAIRLHARATLLGGNGALVNVFVNGGYVATLLIDATESKEYVLDPSWIPSSEAIETIDLAFVNDAASTTEDRNLIIDGIEVRGQVVSPTGAGTLIDRGSGLSAFDGVDVEAGQSTLWRNSALRIKLKPV